MSESLSEIHKYFEVLGLAPGATPEEIKKAYRQLAYTWHPDRYANNPPLRAVAENNMKELNYAYDRLIKLAPTLNQRVQPAATEGASSSTPRPPTSGAQKPPAKPTDGFADEMANIMKKLEKTKETGKNAPKAKPIPFATIGISAVFVIAIIVVLYLFIH